MSHRLAWLAVAVLGSATSVAQAFEYDTAIDCSLCDQWNAPQKPFRIYGNTYYVGAVGLSAILIDTDDGLILIDGGLPQTAAVIDANIRELGFSVEDIRFIGLSHAHFDHAGGLAALQRLSKAKVLTSRAAADVLRSGNLLNDDPLFDMGSLNTGFPAVNAVETIDDGDTLSIGNASISAIYTPGHTTGGVTWVWSSCEQERCLNIVYADSLSAVSANGFRFTAGNSTGAGEQLRGSAEVIAALDCDIFLSPHPFFFGMREKLDHAGSDNPFIDNPFIDDQGCKVFAETSLAALERRLASEESHVRTQ